MPKKPKPTERWEIVSAISRLQITKKLDEGWEPFAVAWMDNEEIYYFKRRQ
jgi:hypothetical protein